MSELHNPGDRHRQCVWITRPSPSLDPLAKGFGLEPDVAARIASMADVVEYRPGDIMQRATERVTYCLLVTRGMASMSCARHGTEADLVLAPDIANASVLLGMPGTDYVVKAVTSVTAYRVDASLLAVAMDADPALRSLLLTMTSSSIERLRRRTACHLVHKPEARLASWILHHHGTGQGPLRVTHDMLAGLLGVRRPTVTITIHALESLRAISARRSCIEVRDASRLRERACSCHRPFPDGERIERTGDAEATLRTLAMLDRSPQGASRRPRIR